MKKFTDKLLQFISFRIIGRKRTRKSLVKLVRSFDLDMLQVAHSEMGINSYGNNSETGEAFFLEKYLHEKYSDQPIIIFDVGANVGDYSLLLNKNFSSSKIYAFEPNPVSFKALGNKTASLNNIHSFCMGFGSAPSQMEIFTYKNDKASEHASIIKDVMVSLHNSKEVESYQIEITSLDDFCDAHAITEIHFLKIDTEGFELEVLKGAANFIKNRAIKVIQFEFNEMNIFSRVFLRDFYNILPGYQFYRLGAQQLIPLGKYDSSNEIFKYQNIVALLDIAQKIAPSKL